MRVIPSLTLCVNEQTTQKKPVGGEISILKISTIEIVQIIIFQYEVGDTNLKALSCPLLEEISFTSDQQNHAVDLPPIVRFLAAT